MTVVTTCGVGYASGAATERYLLACKKGTPTDGTAPVILALHGHGGDAVQLAPMGSTALGIGYFVNALAEAGFVVLSVDDAGVASWGDTAAMSRATDAVAFAAVQGYKTSKVGVFGWSMGGLNALNWIKRNPSLVATAWLWAPATDLDFFNATAGYTPSYATSSVALGAYASEIVADFSPYATASNGYRIRDEPASWRGIAPIRIAHAQDDAVVPYGQSSSFVAAVNDPLVTLKTIATGGHTGLFAGVTDAEVIAHFRASLT